MTTCLINRFQVISPKEEIHIEQMIPEHLGMGQITIFHLPVYKADMKENHEIQILSPLLNRPATCTSLNNFSRSQFSLLNSIK